MKNYSIQSSKECLFFVFCLFCFLLLSNNTLHLMFYTYICYSNIFQYKYIIQINCPKTILCACDFKIYLFNIYHIISLFIFVCLDFILFHEPLILLCCLTHFMLLVFSYTPWKHQKSGDVLTFSGGL